ncbi:MAG: CocE/NonD family hydrolase, partial [Pseudomonadales bacterium]|nr:CocE/NonD family hydrolase [Pseudomonadales bacterium]
QQVIHYGYNVVSVDFRGTGASFGEHAGETWRNASDVSQVVDWIAAQPWATDKVGMIGGSWEGVIQLATMVYQPKHLTCIIPQIPPSIMNATYDGGLAMIGFAKDWSAMRQGQDSVDLAAPVDGEEGLALFEEAQASRAPVYPSGADRDALTNMTIERYLAATVTDYAQPPSPELGLLGDVFDEFPRMNGSQTAVYLQTGWWDMTFPGKCIDLYRALTVPKRIIVGPWNHGVLPTLEPLRWFDYWLRGIDNGIMEEPGMIFSTSDKTGSATWKGTQDWPLPENETQNLFLTGEAQGADASVDGGLSDTPPAERSVDYTVAYDVGMGDCGRMRFMLRDEYIRHPDLNIRARRCMAFSGAPLAGDIEITGTPTLWLEMSTSAGEGAIHATLEEVTPDGEANYLSEGWLSLKHRKIGTSLLPHDGSAYHSQRNDDLLDVTPGERMTVPVELYPVSVRVGVGNRIRVVVAGTDADNLYVPAVDPAPELTVYLGGENGSRLELPVERAEQRPADRILEGAFADQDAGYAFGP